MFYYSVPSQRAPHTERYLVGLDVYKGDSCHCPAFEFGERQHLNFKCTHILSARECFFGTAVRFHGPLALSESPYRPVRLEPTMWDDGLMLMAIRDRDNVQRKRWGLAPKPSLDPSGLPLDEPLDAEAAAELVDVMGVDL